jgi:hypothetical protein
MGKNYGMGRLFIRCTSLAVHRWLYIFTFASRCLTNSALAYRKKGRMVLFLARMVYPIAHPGLLNPEPPGGYYTWQRGLASSLYFWHYRTGYEVGERKSVYDLLAMG